MIRRLLADEMGIALPTAMSMLMVVSLLVAAGLATSTQLSQSSNRDQDRKRALSAAEAGLQTAIYRLNQIRNPAVPGTMCLTTAPVAADVGTGECPASPTESLGNGAYFYYYVSRRLGDTGTCALTPGQVAGTRDRCVTAVGTADGVTRRLQVRVSEQDVFGGFFDVGLLGKSLVYAYNSISMTADIGSNAAVYLNNSITVDDGSQPLNVDGKVKLLEGGTYTAINSVSVEGGLENITEPYELPQADFERFDGESGGVAAPSENDNSSLPTPYYNAANKSFIVSTGPVTINPGTYYLCHFFLGSSVNFRINNQGLNFSNGMTRILIDSPARPGNNCPAVPTTYTALTAGTFGVDNSVLVNDHTKREELFQVYMYGSGNEQEDLPTSRYSWCTRQVSPLLPGECRSDFMLDNSVQFYGSVYAPDSTVQARNSVQIWGGLAGDKIRLFNSVSFTVTPEVQTAPALAAGAALKKGWTECRPNPSVTGDPESGC
jgi:type II secretory pathway pseudopilin PulG